jgi:L-threonylcarbamoyladenylate synthase
LVAADFNQISPFLKSLSSTQLERLYTSWPGSKTWAIPNNGTAPPWITGTHSTVALRISAHPVVKALCELVGGPIISTSANPQGQRAARTALRARCYFGQRIDYYAPGQTGSAQHVSEIRDLLSNKILRPG